MIHDIQEKLRNEPVGTKVHRIVFVVVGVLALALEIFGYISQGRISGSAQFVETVSFAVALCLAFMWAGFRPGSGGALVFLLAIVEAYAWTQVGFPALLLYGVTVDWISRRWYWPTIGFLMIFGALSVARSDARGQMVLTLFVFIGASVMAGLAVRRSDDKITRLEQEAREAREAAEYAKEQVYEELAAKLHDTAVRDLVRLISLNESPADSPEEEHEKERLMGVLAREALHNLRAAMGRAAPSQEIRPLDDVVAICQQMLSVRSISFLVDIADEARDVLTADFEQEVALVIQEGATNILKYGLEKSDARLVIDGSRQNGVSVLMTNAMAEGTVDLGPLSGGFGLHNLSSLVEARGARLFSGASGSSWTLIVEFPSGAQSTPSLEALSHSQILTDEEGGHDGLKSVIR